MRLPTFPIAFGCWSLMYWNGPVLAPERTGCGAKLFGRPCASGASGTWISGISGCAWKTSPLHWSNSENDPTVVKYLVTSSSASALFTPQSN